MIDQDTDLLLLATIARENETQAELVARFITPRKPNFSQIAYGILECYPDNIRIHDALTNSCVEEEAVWAKNCLSGLQKSSKKLSQQKQTLKFHKQ